MSSSPPDAPATDSITEFAPGNAQSEDNVDELSSEHRGQQLSPADNLAEDPSQQKPSHTEEQNVAASVAEKSQEEKAILTEEQQHTHRVPASETQVGQAGEAFAEEPGTQADNACDRNDSENKPLLTSKQVDPEDRPSSVVPAREQVSAVSNTQPTTSAPSKEVAQPSSDDSQQSQMSGEPVPMTVTHMAEVERDFEDVPVEQVDKATDKKDSEHGPPFESTNADKEEAPSSVQPAQEQVSTVSNLQSKLSTSDTEVAETSEDGSQRSNTAEEPDEMNVDSASTRSFGEEEPTPTVKDIFGESDAEEERDEADQPESLHLSDDSDVELQQTRKRLVRTRKRHLERKVLFLIFAIWCLKEIPWKIKPQKTKEEESP